jgi:hypothetical protein
MYIQWAVVGEEKEHNTMINFFLWILFGALVG